MESTYKFEDLAINKIEEKASKDKEYKISFINNIFKKYNLNIDDIINKLLSKKITLNFHPDRLSKDEILIIKGLINDGKYKSQFETKTTNGGKTAYVGGQRFEWEQDLFLNAYPSDYMNRPKYGALNIFDYIDGGASRFGSCYFTLNENILPKCTFSYGDSFSNPDTLCTKDSFYVILYDALIDVIHNNQFLNIADCNEDKLINILKNIHITNEKLGNNLDDYIEVHIHGDICLMNNVDSIYIDESFKDDEIYDYINELCEKYNIDLKWIPKRVVKIEDIDEEFRGDVIKTLSKDINEMFGKSSGYIDALQIGKASCLSITNKEEFNRFGDEEEVFQYIKYIWHVIAFYG